MKTRRHVPTRFAQIDANFRISFSRGRRETENTNREDRKVLRRGTTNPLILARREHGRPRAASVTSDFDAGFKHRKVGFEYWWTRGMNIFIRLTVYFCSRVDSLSIDQSTLVRGIPLTSSLANSNRQLIFVGTCCRCPRATMKFLWPIDRPSWVIPFPLDDNIYVNVSSNFLTPHKFFESQRLRRGKTDSESFVSFNYLRIKVPKSEKNPRFSIIVQFAFANVFQRWAQRHAKDETKAQQPFRRRAAERICLRPNRRDSSWLAWVALSK